MEYFHRVPTGNFFRKRTLDLPFSSANHAAVTFEIALLLGLVLLALVCFSFEWIGSDVVALGLLLALVLTGLLSAKDAFAGFGSETVLMILGLLIMTSALVKTGVVDLVGRAILRHAGKRPATLLAVIMISVAMLSAFISNTAAAAFFLPVGLGVAATLGVFPAPGGAAYRPGAAALRPPAPLAGARAANT